MRPRGFDHDEARRLRAEGWKIRDIADRFGVSANSVSLATRGTPCPVNHTRGDASKFDAYRAARRARITSKADEVVRLRVCGHGLSEIAEKTGVSKTTASRLCRGTPKGEPSGRLMKDVVAIPSWLPPHLHSTYLDIGAKRGEEAAASHCRRLKQESAAACR